MIPVYLLRLIVAFAHMGTNTYDFHQRNLGTLEVEPWRSKTAAPVTRAISAIREFMQGLWGHRRSLALATLICLAILAPATLHGAGAVGMAIAIPQLESDLRAKKAAAKDLLEKTMRACEAHVVAATATTPEVTGRHMTPEEKAAIETVMAEGRAIKAQLDATQGAANLRAEIERLTDGMTPAGPADPQRRVGAQLSLGQSFVADASYREFIKRKGHQTQGMWTSPAVDVQATTLDTTAGSGGPLIVPDFRPGIIPLLFRRLVVADLIAPGTTDSNLISFMKEKTFTNAAAAVAQGVAKPESTLVYEAATAAVKKIAHWIPTTSEMLEDFAQTMSLIDARLRLGIDLAEEDELLNGSGVGEHQLGLNTLPGLTAAQARGADSNMDAIFKQITTIATTVFVQPDGVVMNPINWQTIQLLKNAAGNYMGSGPWAPAQSPTLWGLPIAVTPAEVANSALVGAYRQCAQFFRKGGVRVAASNSHANFFVENKVAVLGEERGAMAVYREAAFGKVTGLN